MKTYTEAQMRLAFNAGEDCAIGEQRQFSEWIETISPIQDDGEYGTSNIHGKGTLQIMTDSYNLGWNAALDKAAENAITKGCRIGQDNESFKS